MSGDGYGDGSVDARCHLCGYRTDNVGTLSDHLAEDHNDPVPIHEHDDWADGDCTRCQREDEYRGHNCYYHDGDAWKLRPATHVAKWNKYGGAPVTRYLCDSCAAKARVGNLHPQKLEENFSG